MFNIIISYTSPWYFVLYLSYAWVIPPLRHCYICVWLLRYVRVIHTFFSLVALHIGNLIMCILCILIVMLFLPSLLAYIHNSELIYIFLNYLSNALTPIYFPNFSISYVFISITIFSSVSYS